MSEAYRPSVTESLPAWTTDTIRKPEQGSDAFRLRYNHRAPAEAIKKDVESYLGEYRLQVQKYDFELGYSNDGSGYHLRSLDDGESMLAKAHRATEHCQKHNPQKVERRVSEYVGIQEEERILERSLDGDRYIYFSPPDPNKEDEEGKYGFAFVNQVVRKGQETRVKKTAIRLESQQIKQYRDIMSYITNQDLPFTKPEDFIANPIKLHSQLTSTDVDILLSQFFNFQSNQENQQRFEMIMSVMHSEIDTFVQMIKGQCSPQDIQKTFYALENRALKLKDSSLESLREMVKDKSLFNEHNYLEEEELRSFIDLYGFVPPTVGGSCGSTASESANIFGFNSGYSSLGFEAMSLPSNSVITSEAEGMWKEVCVTCPYCSNEEKNLFNGRVYKCGNRGCSSNK